MNREPIHKGIVVGLAVLTCALFVSGLYLWGGIIARDHATIETPTANTKAELRSEDATTTEVSRSHEIPDIETDLNAVHFDTVTPELEAIEDAL